MKKLLNKLFSKSGVENSHIPKKTSYIVILGLIGLMLLIISNVFSHTQEEADEEDYINNQSLDQPAEEMEVNKAENSEVTSDVKELEASYEKELEEMLNKIQGVSEVEVMVNLDSTNINVYEKNLIKGRQTTEETDQHGGDRTVEDNTEESQAVLLRQGDREVPILVQTKKPEVRGVFVIAKGADHKTVENWIVESVSRVLDVSTHKISVMPKN